MSSYPEAAFVSVFGSQTPASNTWLYKNLIGVGQTEPRGDLSNYQQKTPYGDFVISSGRTCSGEWIDTVVFVNWLNNAITKTIFDVFEKSSKPKKSEVEIAITGVLNLAVKIGGIQPRFTITSKDSSNRKLLVSFKAILKHAIHRAEINGTLNI